MCTVSWVFSETAEGVSYDLFFNRDESRLRGRAIPPASTELPGGPAIMPTDTDAGGTWVVTNAHGLTVALLNLYQPGSAAWAPPPSSRPLRSRGLLVRDLGDATDLATVEDRLDRLDPSLYRPFTLLVVDPVTAASGPRTAVWDGTRLGGLRPAEPPLVSSGHDLATVLAHRRALWQQSIADGADSDACLEFHRSHQPTRSALSPCMHRHDARTVSLVHVRTTPARVSMRYADGPPCRSALGSPVHLDRHGQPTRSTAVSSTVSNADAA